MTNWPSGEACPVWANCRHAGGGCLGCYVPEEGRGPTQYLPRDPKILHPATIQANAERAARRKAAKQSAAAKRGQANRRKGQRVEREFAKLAGGQRIPLSGALRGALSNDVALPPDLGGLRVEVKYRTAGLTTLYKWVLDDVEKPDAVVVKMPTQPFLVIQTYEQWVAGRQPVAVDLAKLAEAQRLLNEALDGD
jgi:hypothetical protein